MKQVNLEEASKELKEKGLYKIPNFLSDKEIKEIEFDLESILKLYNAFGVQDRLFYKRENTGNRQGDAVMVSFENSILPHLKLRKDTSLGKCLATYNNIVGKTLGKEIPNYSRSMLNVQQYFKNSLPVWTHYDAEFFKFRHEISEKRNEKYCKIEKGLIPRYVAVFITKNENKGKGTYIVNHKTSERTDINAVKGDMFIFDNLKVRHGVPELAKPRSMFGFRNFDFFPYEFQENPKNKDDYEFLEDADNPGYTRPITPEEATKLILKFNKKWKNESYAEYMKKDAAF